MSRHKGAHYPTTGQGVFVKLNYNRRSGRGLGHSKSESLDYTRRASSAQFSPSSACNSKGAKASCRKAVSVPRKPNIQFEPTQRRRVYDECSVLLESQKTTDDMSFLLRAQNCGLDSRTPTSEGDDAELQENGMFEYFRALLDFRLQNKLQCYGDRQKTQPLKDCLQPRDPTYSTRKNIATTMPYAFRQITLRQVMSNEPYRCFPRSLCMGHGLNKSLALRYQSMY